MYQTCKLNSEISSSQTLGIKRSNADIGYGFRESQFILVGPYAITVVKSIGRPSMLNIHVPTETICGPWKGKEILVTMVESALEMQKVRINLKY